MEEVENEELGSGTKLGVVEEVVVVVAEFRVGFSLSTGDPALVSNCGLVEIHQEFMDFLVLVSELGWELAGE